MSIRSPRNFQLDSWHPARLFLFVNLATAILTVASAGIVAGHRPIGPNLSEILWATLFGILVFAIPFRTVRVGYRVVAVIAIGAGAVLYVFWPAILTRATITTSGDASNYAAFAQYLFRYARDTAGNLAPIDQYASFFSDTRFATPSVLSVLTWFCDGDPGFGLGPFTALLLINVFAGFTMLTHQLGCSIRISLLAGVSVLLFGWVPNMIYVGSLDNLFFLAFLPFVFVRLRLIMVGQTKVRSNLAFGITLAALFYAYPEGVLIASAIFFPVLIAVAIHAWKKREILTRVGWSISIALLLVVPYLRTFVEFLSGQIHTTSQLMVFADGVFPGLQTKAFIPAAFALGQEFPGVTTAWPDLLLSLLLGAFTIFGLLRWLRTRQAYCWSFACFLVIVLSQGVQEHHSYGIYKILTIGSILAVPLIFVGIEEICFRLFRNFRQLVAVALGCLLLSLTIVRVSQNTQSTPKRIFTKLDPYLDLRKLMNVTQGAPLSLVCDNNLDYKWALIYLRDQPQEQKVERIGLLFPELRSLMEGAKQSVPAKYVLVSRNLPGAVWKNEKFSLVPVSDEFAPIVALNAANGAETVNGASFIWLSNTPSSFAVDSPREGQAILWARKVQCGPSRPNDTSRTVVVQTDSGTYEQRVQDAFSVPLRLKKGMNSVQLWCRELPTLKVLPNGDRRALLLGLEDYQIKLIPGS